MEQTKEELIQLRDEAIQTQKDLDARIDKMDKEEAKEKKAKKVENLKKAKLQVNAEFKILLEKVLSDYNLDKNELDFKLILSGTVPSKPSTSNANDTDKKPRQPQPPKWTYLDDAGKVVVKKGKQGNLKNDFVNKHKVTRRLLVDGKWLYWNEHINLPKPEWANDETLANVPDQV